MSNDRNKLYLLIFIACIAGYIWLYWSLNETQTEIEVCFVKNITSIPCPSCGSTRSIVSLLNGDFVGAITMNPLGYIVALIMFVSPLWILFDILYKRNTLFTFYRKIESYLKKPHYSLPMILFLIINWIWNITKGL